MTDNLKALRNVYTIEEMVQICVKGDVVTAANADYLRRNLGEFFGELNNALRESQYMYAELEEQLANNHTAVSVYQRDIKALRERVAALENAAKVAHVAMVAMGNDLNWDMKDFGYGPPYFFPVEFNSAMAELRELTAEGVTE